MEYRGWMRDPSKRSEEYIRGVNEFLEFAFQNSKGKGKILCPCRKCANYKSHSRTSVYEHLTDPRHGFLRGYRQWIFHGEKPTTSSSTSKQHIEMEHGMDGLSCDVYAMHPIEEPVCVEGERNPKVGENPKFYQLVKENEQMLYLNCKKHSKLKNKIRKRVHCMGKIRKSKKLKGSLSENQELLNRVKHMENILANVMTILQNRFFGEDVNDIIQAARQVSDASSAPSHLSSQNPDTCKADE